MVTKAAEARLSEEDKNARIAKDKLRRKLEAALRRDLNETFATPAGRRSLYWFMTSSGYQKYDTVADPESGEIMPRSSFYNMARRNFYLNLRQFLKKDILRDVEHRDDVIEDLGLDLFR